MREAHVSKSKVKQSPLERLARLTRGQCPVHGIGMAQVGLTADERTFIAECPRGDCNIRAETPEPHGPLVLLPEFHHLLGSSPGHHGKP